MSLGQRSVTGPDDDFAHRLTALESGLAEITGALDRQAELTGGLVLVLRALLDILLDEEQRATLVSHLEMTVDDAPHSAARSIVDTLLD